MKIKAKELNATHIGMIYTNEDSTKYDFKIDKIRIQNGYVDIEGENIHKGFRDAAGSFFETEITVVAPAKKFTVELDENELEAIKIWYSYYSDYNDNDLDRKLMEKLDEF